MNTSQLKSYAPAARKAFIEAVTAQASRLGITAQGCEPATVQGDVLLICGQAFPIAINEAREKLVQRVKAQGFGATMESIAYTWFNRLIAIRFMELQGYLDHGYRVLSHPEGRAIPEILDYGAEIDLPGLDREQAIALKLDGTRDEELYRLLLIAQCNALHGAMPFLFERLGDETELLLPGNLLHSDSLIRQLVEGIDESAWAEIEVIGWLYQFYIAERKDQVIGKVVPSADIPAATQLFTPNWIVKYMVQNSLGAQWLATYPDSPLKAQMAFYIEPAEQSPDVLAQLREITPSSLDPEQLTLIDPACGSGHILVEAYDLLKAIYLERGYRLRDVPKLILEKNLFGLDICPRAAQLAGFALMMKGRADDRRLFERQVGLNVRVLVDSGDLDVGVLVQEFNLADYGLKPQDLTEFKQLFEYGSVFGSLIQIPARLAQLLPGLRRLAEVENRLLAWKDQTIFRSLVAVAELLAAKYDVVVANPPYMGSKFHIPIIKKFLKENYDGYEKDSFSAFIDRCLAFCQLSGEIGVVAPYVWMFISSYQELRERLIAETTLTSLIQLEYNAFEPACIPVATFTLMRRHVSSFTGSYIKLSDFKGHQNQAPRTLEAIKNPDCGWFYRSQPDEFKKIPGTAIAYWVSHSIRDIFSYSESLGKLLDTRLGMSTANNDIFVREWYEICYQNIYFKAEDRKDALDSQKQWFPYQKGGSFRKWYGNVSLVVDWENDGKRIRSFGSETGKIRSHNYNLDYIFKSGITWTDITSSKNAFRWMDIGYLFDGRGSSGFSNNKLSGEVILGFLNTNLSFNLLQLINPTLSINVNEIQKLPIISKVYELHLIIYSCVEKCIDFSRKDWDSYETSWDFQQFPLLTPNNKAETLEKSYQNTRQQWVEMTLEMRQLEEENNRIFIEAYGLQDELTPDVPLKEITLTCNPYYRYSKEASQGDKNQFPQDPDLETRLRQDTMQELISYAIGCMMGRYSLNRPGLIYAHSENKDFDPSQYQSYPADDDGIIPLSDTPWFADDAAHRLVEFVATLWGTETLETNLTFLADNLGAKKDETSRETLRRYLCDNFFKDHLKTYKKRPIYWLFSSGKQKAFQCLIYLHRYNQATLSRMRGEYVIPLQGKIAARLENLVQDIQAATSTAHRKQLEKEQTKLQKQNAELLAFDEKLRHHTDLRISLDLDDGVKVNYSKFGDLLAEVKAICGKKDD